MPKDFFDEFIVKVEAAINREVKVPIYQYEYDSIVSILYNTGHSRDNGRDKWPGTRTQYLARYLNRGEYHEMKDVILNFISGRVLWRRRLEANLFATGVYDARH